MSEAETKNLAELKKELEERLARTERELSFIKLSIVLVNEALAKGSFKPASRLLETEARPEPQVQVRGEPPAAQPVEDAKIIKRAVPPVAFVESEPTLPPAPKPVAAASPSAPTPTQPAPTPTPSRAPTQPPPSTPSPMAYDEEEQAFAIKSKLGEDLGVFYVGRGYVRVTPRPDLNFSIKTPPFQSFFIDRVLGEMHRKDEMSVDAGAKDPSSMIAHEVRRDGDTIKDIVITNIDEEARIRELRSSIRWTLERMLEKGVKK